MTKGRFGIHGGQYIPETLMNAVLELERAYEYIKTTRPSGKNCASCTVIMPTAPACCITRKR